MKISRRDINRLINEYILSEEDSEDGQPSASTLGPNNFQAMREIIALGRFFYDSDSISEYRQSAVIDLIDDLMPRLDSLESFVNTNSRDRSLSWWFEALEANQDG